MEDDRINVQWLHSWKTREERMLHLDIICQSLKHPLTTSCIHQCQAVIRAPPFSPLSVKSCVVDRACCWGWQTTAEGRRDRRGREPEREKQGRRGSERYSSESSEARQIQWRNPPSSQMNIAASLPPPPRPPPPPVSIVVTFPSSLPRSSIIHQCAESPQLTAPAAAAPAEPPSLLDLLLNQRPLFPAANLASIPSHGDSELALFCC